MIRPRSVNLRQLAERTGLSYATVKRWRAEGTLTSAELVGNQWLVSDTEVKRLERQFKDLRRRLQEFDRERAHSIRVAAGLSQRDMADAVGVVRTEEIHNWETGRYKPSLEVAERYFRILDQLEAGKWKVWRRNGGMTAAWSAVVAQAGATPSQRPRPGNRLGARKQEPV